MTVTDLRPFTIGGSDAAAAAGVHPYVSQVELWATKTGRMTKPESEAMAWGKRLEPLIFDVLREQGQLVAPAGDDHFADSEFAWMTGHPDGFVVDKDGYWQGVLEVKTANMFAWPKEGVPVQYQAQAQWYMMLTGMPSALVAALVNGQRLEVHEVGRDQSAITLLRLLAAEFYEHLRRDIPPPPDGSESARDALRELFPGATAEKVYRLTRDEWNDVRELRARKQQADAIAEQVRAIENRLKAAMGDAERAISPHDTDALRWSNVTSARVDTKALRDARPDVAEEFTTHTTSRRFTLL